MRTIIRWFKPRTTKPYPILPLDKQKYRRYIWCNSLQLNVDYSANLAETTFQVFLPRVLWQTSDVYFIGLKEKVDNEHQI